eukprot:15336665-Ditylum_brightwellii.AAC.1
MMNYELHASASPLQRFQGHKPDSSSADRTMTNCEINVSAIPLQRAQEYKPDSFSADRTLFQKGRQTEETFAKVGLSQELSCDFVKMTTPNKNGQTRASTEYHVVKFVSCFEKTQDEMDMYDASHEEDSEDENE